MTMFFVGADFDVEGKSRGFEFWRLKERRHGESFIA